MCDIKNLTVDNIFAVSEDIPSSEGNKNRVFCYRVTKRTTTRGIHGTTVLNLKPLSYDGQEIVVDAKTPPKTWKELWKCK